MKFPALVLMAFSDVLTTARLLLMAEDSFSRRLMRKAGMMDCRAGDVEDAVNTVDPGLGSHRRTLWVVKGAAVALESTISNDSDSSSSVRNAANHLALVVDMIIIVVIM